MMSATNICDGCGYDKCRIVGTDNSGTPLSWCNQCGTLMGLGTWYPAKRGMSTVAADAADVLKRMNAVIAEQTHQPAAP